MKNIEICEIEEDCALNFLRANKANRESVSISSAQTWFGAFSSQELIGVVGVKTLGKKKRIKAFYVNKNHRRLGVGNALLSSSLTPNETHTAFATKDSVNLFRKHGFLDVWTNSNGITFLIRG